MFLLSGNKIWTKKSNQSRYLKFLLIGFIQYFDKYLVILIIIEFKIRNSLMSQKNDAQGVNKKYKSMSKTTNDL